MKFTNKFILISLLLLVNRNVFSADLNEVDIDFIKKLFITYIQGCNGEQAVKEIKKFSLAYLNQVIKKEISLGQAVFGINEQIDACEAALKNIDDVIASKLKELQADTSGLVFSNNERQQIKDAILGGLQSCLPVLREQKLFLEKLKNNGNEFFVQVFLAGKLTDELINMHDIRPELDKEVIKIYYLLKELYGYGKKQGTCQRISESCVIL